MITAVLIVKNATLTSISTFHDLISNEIPTILGSWNFEFKIFKINPIFIQLLQDSAANSNSNQDFQIYLNQQKNKIMFTLNLSYLNNKIITVINKTFMVFNHYNSQNLPYSNSNPNQTSFESDFHAEKNDNQGISQYTDGGSQIDSDEVNQNLTLLGCSNGGTDSIDSIITNRLSSNWALRQTIVGKGGNSYYLTTIDDNPNSLQNCSMKSIFKIRTANCFSHGNFRGFLIEINYHNDSSNIQNQTEVQRKNQEQNDLTTIKNLLNKLNFPVVDDSDHKFFYQKLNSGKSNYHADLANQYINALS
ncbi:Srb2p ASCRUDRAFT_8172 [Ascoidea rubescens DSM 1968]|uniref:Mediator of RNA polymerase II transcription subunit 20 n=1 Tax=Ascoidea rubescens DSM 1968 TaxID=1344418 RepID=A0A1D2VHV5_9ASCO|nr:hypothetical protein ASCRUDRAFT_8172 [Ascoidea rubescens DSM 1968]ODV61241.1 hypothetical protein ASCRUDRAFT_8172 [Ascoidea rubescens DSM 1968]